MISESRPWGGFDVLADTDTHKVKRLTVEPGQRLSYQRHSHRSEHWFILASEGTVTIDGVPHKIAAGSAVDIPAGAAHRIENTGPVALVLIEVQHGTYFGDDDIERLDDDYGRAASH